MWSVRLSPPSSSSTLDTVTSGIQPTASSHIAHAVLEGRERLGERMPERRHHEDLVDVLARQDPRDREDVGDVGRVEAPAEDGDVPLTRQPPWTLVVAFCFMSSFSVSVSLPRASKNSATTSSSLSSMTATPPRGARHAARGEEPAVADLLHEGLGALAVDDEVGREDVLFVEARLVVDEEPDPQADHLDGPRVAGGEALEGTQAQPRLLGGDEAVDLLGRAVRWRAARPA